MRKTLLAGIIIFFAVSSHAEVDVVARVNGSVITSKDLEQEIDRLIPQSTYHRNVPPERRIEFRDKAIENLINQELQYQDAVAKGMKPDKKLVKAQMTQIKDRFKSKKEYRAALDRASITEDELQARVEKNVLIQTAIAKTAVEPSQVSEAELKDYYNKNISKFKQPESVRLRVISTKGEKKAKEILGRINGGEDFGNVAADMSEDDYRIRGGDIGTIHKGRMVPELEETAFRLKSGGVSGIIKAQGMYYIIKAEEKRPEYQMTFEESKDKLKKDLEKKRFEELMEKWLADLRAMAKIEVFVKAEDEGQKTEDKRPVTK